jgi:hypothetical protein
MFFKLLVILLKVLILLLTQFAGLLEPFTSAI